MPTFQLFASKHKGVPNTIREGRLQTASEAKSWEFIKDLPMSKKDAIVNASALIAFGDFTAVRVFRPGRGGTLGRLIYTGLLHEQKPKAAMIKNLEDLCDFFGADAPRSLNRRIYKDTECGASLSLYLGNPNRKRKITAVLHSGDPKWDKLPSDTPIVGFTIQTIVEGSDAIVSSEVFRVPVPEDEVTAWIKHMEEEAARLWNESHIDEKNA